MNKRRKERESAERWERRVGELSRAYNLRLRREKREAESVDRARGPDGGGKP